MIGQIVSQTRYPPFGHVTRHAVSLEDSRIPQKIVPDIVKYYSNDNDMVYNLASRLPCGVDRKLSCIVSPSRRGTPSESLASLSMKQGVLVDVVVAFEALVSYGVVVVVTRIYADRHEATGVNGGLRIGRESHWASGSQCCC
ncbi:hypothetical protein BHM03_00057992 [Ensete ventricosum]|nr:hypothetical protein BHM03_00057992 [Ensete ventricosum]